MKEKDKKNLGILSAVLGFIFFCVSILILVNFPEHGFLRGSMVFLMNISLMSMIFGVVAVISVHWGGL